jgi:anaerobic magnesium-protoporphyrin IX monomethyl ester cyclase
MIILHNPRSTRPRNRRLPLSVLALGAVLEGREEYEIVDGNLDDNPTETILRLIQEREVEMLGVSVMPGPQMAAAVESCREIRRLHPKLPIVWGGYFPSIYSDATLNARYVDYAVRGQGEDTLLELLDALRGKKKLEEIAGLSFKDVFGLHRHNPERPMKGPDAFRGPLSTRFQSNNTCALLSSASAPPCTTPASAARSDAVFAAFMRPTAIASAWRALSARKPYCVIW